MRRLIHGDCTCSFVNAIIWTQVTSSKNKAIKVGARAIFSYSHKTYGGLSHVHPYQTSLVFASVTNCSFFVATIRLHAHACSLCLRNNLPLRKCPRNLPTHTQPQNLQ
jgi:hypothetical protein